MTNAESVDKYRIVVRHILAMRHRANCGVNRMKFITLTTVPHLLPFVKAELGDLRKKFSKFCLTNGRRYGTVVRVINLEHQLKGK